MYYEKYESVVRPSRNKCFSCSCGKIYMLCSEHPNYCSDCGVELKDIFSSKREEFKLKHDEYMENLLNRRERFKCDLFKYFDVTEESVLTISAGKFFDMISGELGRDAFEEVHEAFGFWFREMNVKE